MEGISTFKNSYCDFLTQLQIYDNDDIINIYLKKIQESDNMIQDILNNMIEILPNYIDRIQKNDYSIYDEDSDFEFLNEINIKSIWTQLTNKDKQQVFSHIYYCYIIGKFVVGKATIQDIQKLYSMNNDQPKNKTNNADDANDANDADDEQNENENEDQDEEPEEPEVDKIVRKHVSKKVDELTPEEEKKMMNDLSGIQEELEDMEKKIQETLGEESINKMSETIQEMFGDFVSEDNQNNEPNENPFANILNPEKLKQMSDDIKSKVQNGEIDENALKETGDQMMKLIGKLSQNLGPILSGLSNGENIEMDGFLSNITSSMNNDNNDNNDMGDMSGLLSGLMSGMMGGGNNSSKQDPLSRAMSAGMQAMTDRSGDGNPLSGLLGALGGGANLGNDEKSQLRAEERKTRNKKEARAKYRKNRRKRMKQIRKQKKLSEKQAKK